MSKNYLLLFILFLSVSSHSWPQFEFHSNTSTLDDHFEFGKAYGYQFDNMIQNRVYEQPQFGEILGYFDTPEGKELYDQFLEPTNRTYPQYIAELEGISLTSRVPFEHIFLTNIWQEYRGLVPQLEKQNSSYSSNYMMCNENYCVDCHNDDREFLYWNKAIIFNVTLGDDKFLAFVYAGDLPSAAFAFNNHGIGFSLNSVEPDVMVKGGIGKNFISRDLLTSKSYFEAITKIANPDQSGGNNYQLYDFTNRRITNIESCHRQMSIRKIHEPFFHASQYKTLSVEQNIAPSSRNITDRVEQLPVPQTPNELMAVLGDHIDQKYPIFHDAISHQSHDLDGMTIATAMFDLDNQIVKIYNLNPRLQNVLYQYDVKDFVEFN